MGWLLGVVGSRILSLVGAVLAVSGSILAIFMSGKRSERLNRKVQDLEDYKETKERIDEVDASPDRDAALERLRDNDQLR